MKTRRATRRDLPELLASGPGSGSDFDRRRLREAVGRGAVHLRTDGRQIVAWGVVARTFFGRLFIEALWVAPAHRRAGHGEALLAWIEARAGAREEIWTSTNRSNRPMRHLLQKRGFVLKGRVSGLDEGDPELFYVKAPRDRGPAPRLRSDPQGQAVFPTNDRRQEAGVKNESDPPRTGSAPGIPSGGEMKQGSPPAEGLEHGDVVLRFERLVPGEPARGLIPYYHFRILTRSGADVGHINFRVGDTRHVRRHAGHIGFEVLPAFRGHGYALQACRALAPFVRSLRDSVIITCDPDNGASRRTIEQLGAVFINGVAVLPDDPQFQHGSRRKRRYRWTP